jgi:LacI family transcriptional regulator
MATIIDVAKKAKVSVVTVSRLMNNPEIVSSRTADKIFKVFDKLNYQPSQIARSLVKKRTNTIGIVMPDIKNTFFNNWYRYIEEHANPNEFNLVLCNTDEDETKEIKYIKLLQSQRVDGVIIAPTSKKTVEYLLKSNMCFILFDRLFDDLKTNFVTTDHYQGAFDATEYLINLGHSRISIYKGGGTLFPDIERYLGFADAMHKYHLKIDISLIMNCEFNEDKALNATLELLRRKDKPTAIFPFNSLMSKGVIKAVQQLKLKIPLDVSLLSFDEIPGYDIFQPKITHVIQPIKLLGSETIAALINMIKKPNSKKRTKLILKPKLVIGESCKRV